MGSTSQEILVTKVRNRPPTATLRRRDASNNSTRTRQQISCSQVAANRKQQQQQNQLLQVSNAAGGSLSSGGSSSGCSSVECSSLETTTTTAPLTNKNGIVQQITGPPGAPGGASSRDESDFLELNELLYLRSRRGNNNFVPPSMITAGEGPLLPVASMSQFSAFTLRKSIKICEQNTKHRKPQEPQGCGPGQRVRRASSTAIKIGAIEQAGHNDEANNKTYHHHDHHYEPGLADDSCSFRQGHSPPAANLPPRPKHQILGKSRPKLVAPVGVGDPKGWRRATIVGRPPERPAAVVAAAAGGKTMGQQPMVYAKRATVAPFAGLAQRSQARRSLPVPPPVVPLYKEAFFLASARGSGHEDEEGRRGDAPELDSQPPPLAQSCSLRLDSDRLAGGCFEPKGGCHLTEARPVNILHANDNSARGNNNNNNSEYEKHHISEIELHRNRNTPDEMSRTMNIRTNSTPNSNTILGLSDPATKKSFTDSNGPKFHCGLWEDLPRQPSEGGSEGGESCANGDGVVGDKQGNSSSSSTPRQVLDSHPAKGGSGGRHDGRGGEEVVSGGAGSFSVFGGGSGSTFTRRTGKLLERLRLGFLVANFGVSGTNQAAASSSGKLANDKDEQAACESSSSDASKCVKHCPDIATASSYDNVNSLSISKDNNNNNIKSKHEQPQPDLDWNSRIYDTPEFGDDHELGTDSGKSSVLGTRPSFVRPSMPPPSPPPPPPLPSEQMGSMRAPPPPPPPRLERDCAGSDARSSRRQEPLAAAAPSGKFNPTTCGSNSVINWPLEVKKYENDQYQNNDDHHHSLMIDHHKKPIELDSYLKVREASRRGKDGKANNAHHLDTINGRESRQQQQQLDVLETVKKAVRWAETDDGDTNNRKQQQKFPTRQTASNRVLQFEPSCCSPQFLDSSGFQTQHDEVAVASSSSRQQKNYDEKLKLGPELLPLARTTQTNEQLGTETTNVTASCINNYHPDHYHRQEASEIELEPSSTETIGNKRGIVNANKDSHGSKGNCCPTSKPSVDQVKGTICRIRGNNSNKTPTPITTGITGSNKNARLDRLTEGSEFNSGAAAFAQVGGILLKSCQSRQAKLPAEWPANLVTNWASTNMGASHSAATLTHHGTTDGSSPVLSVTNSTSSPAQEASLKSPEKKFVSKPDHERSSKAGYPAANYKISGDSTGAMCSSSSGSQAIEADQQQAKRKPTQQLTNGGILSSKTKNQHHQQQQSSSHGFTCHQQSAIKSGADSKRASSKQLRIGQAALATPATDLMPPKLDDSIEKRRKSIQDGDVFIYPTLYKNLNECQRCSRDNKICSCNNNVEPAELGRGTIAKQQVSSSNHNITTMTTQAYNCKTTKCKPSSSEVMESHIINNNSSNTPPRDYSQERTFKGQRVESHEKVKSTGTRGEAPAEPEATLESQQYNYSDSDSGSGSGRDQIKTVYKISIATASIDKRSNQLRLSTPKVIGASQLSDPIAVACSLSRNQAPRNILNDHERTSHSSHNNKRTLPKARTTNRVNFLLDNQPDNKVNEEIQPIVGRDTLSKPKARISNHASGAIDSEKYETAIATTTGSNVANSKFTAGEPKQEETSKLSLLATTHGYQLNDNSIRNEAKMAISSPTRSPKSALNYHDHLPPTRMAISSEGPEVNCNVGIDLNNNKEFTSSTGESSGLFSKCDGRVGSPRSRSHATIIRKLIEEQEERDGEEQLTCNMSVGGDSIKITSTSISRIGANKFGHNTTNNSCQSLASIIPIQTLSARRRNLASKLSRQAIHEDSSYGSAHKNNNNNKAQPVTLIKQTSLEEEDEMVEDEELEELDSSLQAQDSSSDALEYSPILTSVRDYIKNMNTELQVQSPNLLGANCVGQLPITVSPLTRESLESMEAQCSSNGLAPTITTLACGDIVGSPQTIVSSASVALTITGGSVVTTTGLNMANKSSFTGPSGGLLIHQAADGEDSPKKSIFEGASKDEILEYLEDARERVPEILMAADDVMVINENELIVVNQLEPDSPATPISIVEANEIIGRNAELVPVDSTDGRQQLLVATPEPVSIELQSPDEFRHRLQQIYQQSSQMNGNSQFSSENNTMDEDTGISGSEHQSELTRDVYSNVNFIGAPISQTELKLAGGVSTIANGAGKQPNMKSYASLTGATVNSLENQALELAGIISSAGAAVDQTTNCLALFSIDQGQINLRQGERQIGDPTTKPSQVGHQDQVALNPVTLKTIDQQGSIDSQGLMGGGVRMFNYGRLEARRRNSTSSEGSNRAVASQLAGSNCTIQMLRVKQRYINRDSLSSSSTSPPSSASPSSSTSSNQTSGNCSAASTFYASSSLSCSSPLLALGGTATTNSAPLTSSGNMNHLTASQQQRMQQAAGPGSYPNHQYHDLRMLDSPLIMENNQHNSLPGCAADMNLNNPSQVERDDSGLGSDYMDRNRATSLASYGSNNLDPLVVSSLSGTKILNDHQQAPTNLNKAHDEKNMDNPILSSGGAINYSPNLLDNEDVGTTLIGSPGTATGAQLLIPTTLITTSSSMTTQHQVCSSINSNNKTTNSSSSVVRFNSSANLMSRSVHGHYATMNRLNNYFMNRHPLSENSADTTIEFQCLDCDQFIDVDQATMMHKSNELRLLRETDRLDVRLGGGGGYGGTEIGGSSSSNDESKEKLMTTDQLDRAYIAAMNGLPLCNSCEKKRIERKEIISEFVETELKYGRDLKIIHDEFYRPMQIAGLLSKDQITGVFLNLEELIVANCKFSIRLEAAIRDAHSMGDGDFNTINIGRLFVESAEMLHTFESYCIRQGSAACLLARLAKEKELLRIFLRVSQMENTLLRRMNLAAFLMVPVQRVTKYPLLLNRLYKVTAYHHKDREVLRDAQLKVELHLEHINQQTKGNGATNKIWRRISNLSAPISNRRGLINAEDIGYIKLRKTAMDMLKWDRDETKFIHSGRLNFAPLNEFLIKQKMKPIRYMAAHALLIVLGKPNWKYRPDLVKSNLDNKLMTPTPGGNGVKEAALLLFREKGGRFIPCREPLFLSNCVLSAECSQYNSECPVIQPGHHNQKATATTNVSAGGAATLSSSGAQTGKDCVQYANNNSSIGNNNICNNRNRLSSSSANSENRDSHDRSASTESAAPLIDSLKGHSREPSHSDTISMASVKSLPDNHAAGDGCSPPTHTSRSHSLASALPRTSISPATSSAGSLTKTSSITASNLTIINQLMTKVNSYGHKQQSTPGHGGLKSILVATGEQHKVGPPMAAITNPIESSFCGGSSNSLTQQHSTAGLSDPATITTAINNNNNVNRTATNLTTNCLNNSNNNNNQNDMVHPQYYNHLFFNHHHHQPYGDYEESFELHERLTKESMLLRADTPLKTRYWLQMLRYHAKDLGLWRVRRNGLANIMMMRQD